MARFVDDSYRSTSGVFSFADQCQTDTTDDRTVKSRLDGLDLRIDGITPGPSGTQYDSYAFSNRESTPGTIPADAETFKTSVDNYAFSVNLPAASNGQYWVLYIDNRTGPTSLESLEGRLPVTSAWTTNATVTIGVSTYIVYAFRNLGGATRTTAVRLVRNVN